MAQQKWGRGWVKPNLRYWEEVISVSVSVSVSGEDILNAYSIRYNSDFLFLHVFQQRCQRRHTFMLI